VGRETSLRFRESSERLKTSPEPQPTIIVAWLGCHTIFRGSDEHFQGLPGTWPACTVFLL